MESMMVLESSFRAYSKLLEETGDVLSNINAHTHTAGRVIKLHTPEEEIDPA